MGLFTCGSCGNSYTNPITHVCKFKVSKTGAKRVRKAPANRNKRIDKLK